jgi:hypothetical protein
MFILSPEGNRCFYHLRPTSSKDDSDALFSGEYLPDTPIEFSVMSGRRQADLLTTSYAILDLFSERVIKYLHEMKYSGWRTYPVRVSNRSGQVIPGYFGFSVTGCAGAIDKARAEKIIIPPAVRGGEAFPGFKGLNFKDDYWDGSDIFCPAETALIIVTEEVKHSMEELRMTNCKFTRLTEYAYM